MFVLKLSRYTCMNFKAAPASLESAVDVQAYIPEIQQVLTPFLMVGVTPFRSFQLAAV